MLTTMRGAAGTWLVKILFVLLIISFGAWGLSDFTRSGGSPDRALTVNDQDVSLRSLDQTFRNNIQQMSKSFGTQLTVEQARQIGLLQNTIQQTIDSILLQQATASLALTAGDEAVRSYIRRDPTFAGPDGSFSQSRYDSLLSQAGIVEEEYINSTRASLANSLLSTTIQSGPVVPGPLAAALYEWQAEQRVASVLMVDPSVLPEPAEPAEEELTLFHKENAKLYQTPAWRKVAWISVAPEDLVDQVAVSDAELEAEYQDRLTQFSTPAEMRITQIDVDSAEKANAVLAAIQAGKSFAEAAEAEGLPAPADIGWIKETDLFPGLAEGVAAAPIGQVAGPFETVLGHHLVLVHEKRERSVRSLDEVKDEVRNFVALRKTGDLAVTMANQMIDAFAGGALLGEVAADLGLEIKTIDALASDGSRKDVDNAERDAFVDSLPGGQQFLEEAFRLEPGKTSKVIEGENGLVFALEVQEEMAPELKPLDEVRDEVRNALMLNRREDAGRLKAEEIAAMLRNGTAPTAAAEDPAVSLRVTAAFDRTGAGEETLSAALVNALFAAENGAVVVQPDDNGYAVARLEDIQEADAAANPEQVAQLQERISGSMVGDLQQQFLAALRAGAEIDVNYQRITGFYDR